VLVWNSWYLCVCVCLAAQSVQWAGAVQWTDGTIVQHAGSLVVHYAARVRPVWSFRHDTVKHADPALDRRHPWHAAYELHQQVSRLASGWRACNCLVLTTFRQHTNIYQLLVNNKFKQCLMLIKLVVIGLLWNISLSLVSSAVIETKRRLWLNASK